MVKVRGSKDDVFHGRALKTSSGLTAGALIRNARGKIVSKKQHEQGKKNIERLKAHRFKKKKNETAEDWTTNSYGFRPGELLFLLQAYTLLFSPESVSWKINLFWLHPNGA